MPPNRSCLLSLSLLMSPPMILFALFFILFTLSNVNKTFDLFNIFLVLFLIFFGVFFRKNDDVSCTPNKKQQQKREETRCVSHQWFGFSFKEFEEDNTYHTPHIQFRSPDTGDSRLRQSTSFHHDQRQQSSCETGTDSCKSRCSEIPVNHRTRRRGDEKEDSIKEIPAEKIETRSLRRLPQPRKSPMPPPPTPTPTPSVSPPQQPEMEEPEKKDGRSEKKKRKSMKEEIAMVLTSMITNRKKRKKKSSSIFPGLFKKALCKGQKVHSVLAPTPLRLMPAINTNKQIPQRSVPPPLKSAETEFVSVEMEDADVDAKATTFIAMLKNEWKLEKLRSMKERGCSWTSQAWAQDEAHFR